jgi:hypothetical protein
MKLGHAQTTIKEQLSENADLPGTPNRGTSENAAKAKFREFLFHALR